MQSDKSKRIQQLRNDALDENRTPKDRIKSAERLLSEFGPSDRNLPVIHSVIKTFIKDVNYDTQERAQKLKAKLLKSRELKEIADAELPSEEQAVEPEQEIVAGTSASEVPKPLSISLTEVVAAHHHILGGYKWRMFNEGAVDLSKEERMQLLETILGGAPNVDNVRSLLETVHATNGLGWTIAGSCPSIVRIAQDFLNQKGASVEPPPLKQSEQQLLDRLNRRVEIGVS